MTKAVKCQACGLYYNSTVYNVCPHCNTEMGVRVGTKESGEKKEPKKITVEPEKKDVAPQVTDTPPQQMLKSRMTMPYAEISAEKQPQKQPQKEPETGNSQNAENPQPYSQSNLQLTRGATRPQDAAIDLKQQLRKSGRTVGKFVSGGGDDATDPVVGWLVCVKGTYFGQSFALHSGKNKVGRSHEYDIKLLNDESVSRTCVAVIVFDTKANAFSLLPGESDSLCYVNTEAVYDRKILSGYEKIEFGDSERNMFVFVPLCGEQFNWSSFQNHS